MLRTELPLVVFGCPVSNRSWVLSQWWASIAMQAPLSPYRWKVAFVYTESEDDTLGTLEQMGGWHDVHIIDGGESPRTRDDQNQHRWPIEHIEKMAEWRNMLLDYATEQDATYFFSVDSDIILPPMAFELLVRQMDDVYVHQDYAACAPLVNMAGHLDPGTFAYNFMDWVDNGVTAHAYRSARSMSDDVFRADVIMAAMLIHRSGFGARWSAHEQGEDIGWSWNLAQLGKRCFVDPRVVCNHLMRPAR